MSSALQCTAPSPSPPNPPSNQSMERLRICIRRLPSSLSHDDFLAFLNQTLDKEASAILNTTAISYGVGTPSKSKTSAASFSSAVFLSFQSSGHLNRFYSLVNGKAINKEGCIPIIEYAPIQTFPLMPPSLKVKNDILEGTVEEELTQKLPPGKDTASMRAEKMGPEIFQRPRSTQKAFKLDLSRESSSNDPSKHVVLRRQQTATINGGPIAPNVALPNPEYTKAPEQDDIVVRAQQMAEEAKLKYSEASTNVPGQKKKSVSRKPAHANLQTPVRKKT
ncbi:hypothetical protein DI09_45p20 [Mitosporidium daphniae]|uniref:UPF3 domain-containing protein n=1 Tax=Mitosporidium daphniae TaxID=1485682 RepID=A0A098VQ10_9MICR|nr:uncharacterized protein DI09_45p20 [Mitosporidium daphniae]KGG51075.1 hypothetical protein DI09_45p20 [Mitosporidium daphniae]|eukprot:XP_013237520.1 uncharacterized protein DI09_45p20 [Mitosporidium daphniae]